MPSEGLAEATSTDGMLDLASHHLPHDVAEGWRRLIDATGA